MKRLLILTFVLLPFFVKAQIVETLTDVADVALLISITADVLDNTLMTGEKLKAINDELQATQEMINNPQFMQYTSTYGRNKCLRDIRTNAKRVQIYATTLRNIAAMTTRLVTQIKTVKAEKIKNDIEKLTAKIKAAAAGTSYLGFSASGDADAKMLAQLEDNKITSSGDTFQGLLLEILLELDQFNKTIDEMHYEVIRSRGTIMQSFGVGVLMTHTNSADLYTYKSNYQLKTRKMAESAAAENAAAIKRSREESERLYNDVLECQKRLKKAKETFAADGN